MKSTEKASISIWNNWERQRWKNKNENNGDARRDETAEPGSDLGMRKCDPKFRMHV
jgi:hypothetical protein